MYLLSSDFRAIASFVDWRGDSTAELCICFSTVHIVGSFYLNFLRWFNPWFLPSLILSNPSWKIAFAAAKASSTQPDSVSSDSSDSFLSTQQPSRRRWRTTRTRSPPSRDQCLGIFPSIYQIGRPEVVGRQIECQPEELDVASCYRVLQIAWMFKKSRMRCSICFLLLLLSFFKCFSSKLESFLRQGHWAIMEELVVSNKQLLNVGGIPYTLCVAAPQ